MYEELRENEFDHPQNPNNVHRYNNQKYLLLAGRQTLIISD